MCRFIPDSVCSEICTQGASATHNRTRAKDAIPNPVSSPAPKRQHKLCARRLTGFTLEQGAALASLAVGDTFWREKHHRAEQQQLIRRFDQEQCSSDSPKCLNLAAKVIDKGFYIISKPLLFCMQNTRPEWSASAANAAAVIVLVLVVHPCSRSRYQTPSRLRLGELMHGCAMSRQL